MFSLVLAFFLVTFSIAQPGPKLVDETTRWSQCKDVNQSIYDFQMETLQGQFTDLSQYKGQVLLIINVATFCAYTQQYTDFNPLIEKNVNGGFTILAFPCNQFYLQEPAENHELSIIHESCPQTVEKIGKTDELMYNPVRANDITWNFEKFLIDRKGRPRFRFHPTAWSHGDVVQPFIEQLLNEDSNSL
ncbi:Glutathione peroxidase [Trichostrongylus colubriformis]|uniref:Glutathione peroxidase n=1 Tax=Trichostrongylus colubriformis TaxID=6319 RepID=A0AAN8EZ67_TRICO